MTNARFEVPLDRITSCFEGIIPSAICTVDADGMPNITYLSVVSRLDDEHVALSRQFFNKTDHNTIVNPHAQVRVIEPETGRQFALDLEYERTEREGELFERMRTKLDAVASHEGMGDVFRLKGVDVCRVVACSAIPCDFPEGPGERDTAANITQIEQFSRCISAADDLEDLIQETLTTCSERLGYQHTFIMLADETRERLYTVASSGFGDSGAGSEVIIGEGIIGVAAARRMSVRVTHMGREMSYSQAVRHAAERSKGASSVERAIKLPGIPDVASQLVAPMLAHRQLVGVICVQSNRPGAFQAADETVLNILASQVALGMSTMLAEQRRAADTGDDAEPLQVRHYAEDDSVFLDNEYLIKGVAGAILWRLLCTYEQERRTEFSNRELRLDAAIGLPDIKDNLEARLILLRKRLEERCEWIRLEKSGRGRFRLAVDRPLRLVAVED